MDITFDHANERLLIYSGWSEFDKCQLCNDKESKGGVVIEDPEDQLTLSCLSCWNTFVKAGDQRKAKNLLQEMAIQACLVRGKGG